MHRIVRKATALAVPLVAIALLCTASSARADLTVTVQDGGGTVVTVLSIVGSPTSDLSVGTGTLFLGSSGLLGSATGADFQINILGGESDQGTALSELLSSVTKIKMIGSGSHTLNIVVLGTGYTSPTAPPGVSETSQIGGSVATQAGGDTLSFQSLVAGIAYTPVQTPTLPSPNGSYNDTKFGSISSLASGYSIQENLSMTLKTNQDTVNYGSSTTLTAVPEPTTMALALAALPLVGWRVWRRRRVAATLS